MEIFAVEIFAADYSSNVNMSSRSLSSSIRILVFEGLKSLLTERGVLLNILVLRAQVVAEFGGTWGTRYFAVRAARFSD